jgi:glyoxylase-like metal-dependent hydrolase (beta-lactamase superfamily II)
MGETIPNQPERLSSLVQRLRAPNSGPLTLTGTNSYLVGGGGGREVIVIDPGPNLPDHLEALVAASEKISLIVVTHGHPDHYPGAVRLHEMTNAPVAAYQDATFPYDLPLKDGQHLRTSDATLISIHTPGHSPDHLCFYLEEEDALFTGDLILGIGTVIIAPPKGNMTDYLHSLHKLEQDWRDAKVIYSGHGPEINKPNAKILEYIHHRKDREKQLLMALQAGATTVPEMVEQIYQDVDKRLWPAAARQVMAYLIMLEQQGYLEVGEERPPTVAEEALLNPQGILDPVVRAELGIEPGGEKVRHYRLAEQPPTKQI